MTQTVEIPWGAWYGDKNKALKFPDSWELTSLDMNNARELELSEIRSAIENPMGTPSLVEIAEGKNNAVVVVEDISRPAKLKKILHIVREKLHLSGIGDKKITLIYALGAHRPMNRFDSLKKVGEDILEHINIENHHPYENLIHIGESKKGTPIYLNKTYHEAELKIAIGSVQPHPLAGFGGGAKIVLPGICGIKTLEANHKAGVRGIGVGLGFITELRKDIEDVCGRAGLDFNINLVPTLNRGIAGVFAGHFINAHREATNFAKKVYATDVPKNLNLDVGFFNLYPEDTEFSQALKGLNFFMRSQSIIKKKGAVILMTASTEGRGFHSLQGETGGKLYQNWGDSIVFKAFLRNRKFGVYSPNINQADVYHYYPQRTIFRKSFTRLIEKIDELYGPSVKAGIIPSSNQLPA
ncbi:MAG: lactate racemase domain-containing protein [Promethearchaeia archaeon]